jgi:2,4-dienoyl-CoA reductase-like NADH-dependent reductase (Old Yellow Enzyme family)
MNVWFIVQLPPSFRAVSPLLPHSFANLPRRVCASLQAVLLLSRNMSDSSMSAAQRLGQQIVLRSSRAIAKNRTCKSAMTECLTDAANALPNALHCNLYRTWSLGGIGILVTGNVMVDSRYREAPRNVVLDGQACNTDPDPAFVEWAHACHADPECLAIMQVCFAAARSASMGTNQCVPTIWFADQPLRPSNANECQH